MLLKQPTAVSILRLRKIKSKSKIEINLDGMSDKLKPGPARPDMYFFLVKYLNICKIIFSN